MTKSNRSFAWAWLRSRARGRAWTAGFLLALTLLLAPGSAAAKANGLPVTDCSGCHNGGQETSATITANLNTVAPGQTVRLTVSIAAVNGNKGGLYLQSSDGVGKLSLVAGEPTKLSGSSGLTHSSPKTSSDGKFVTFAVDWTAPAQPGSVEFRAAVLSANGNNQSSGDGPGRGYLSLAFGCAGTKYYQDNDGDGFGSPDSDARVACSQPTLYAPRNDDCDDSVETTHPGAPELCNGRDDDCNGQMDEGLPIDTYCEDKDNDGHGVRAGKTVMGCGPSKGFGLCDNDCADNDPSIFPTATEQCNYRDDNCNGQADENARMTCGEGWCRRSSEGCNASLCTPGEPRAEECNALDDDCDGVVDNGSALCAKGVACVNGSCGTGTPVLLDAGLVVRRDAAAAVRTDGSVDEPFQPATSSDSGGCALGGAPRSAPWWLLSLALALRTRSRRRCRKSGGTS